MAYFWIIESLKIPSLPHYGYHRHIIFAISKPDSVIAGPFESEGEAVKSLNLLGKLEQS